MSNPEQVMDCNGGSPFKQHQNLDVHGLLSPGTPVKNIPTRRQVVSSLNYSQMNQAFQPSWLDPISGIRTATPPWGLHFQNGFCKIPGFPDILQDFSGSQPIPHSTNLEIINSFMPYASTVSCGNASLMNHKMPSLSPLLGNHNSGHLMHSSANQFPLNGKVFLQQSRCSSSSNWADQKDQYGSQVTCIAGLNSFPDSTMNFSGSGEIPSFRGHVLPEKYTQRMLEKQDLEVIGFADETTREEHFMMKEVLAEASFSSMIASSEYPHFQNPDSVKDPALSDGVSHQLTGIDNSLVERENENLDLNDISKLKPKRKKHRPKVIIEGKPARMSKPRTPVPKTPKPAQDKENSSGKRKYTRKNKDTTPCLDATSYVGKIGDTENRNGAKSVRRSLNFDKEESHSFMMSIFMQNPENHAGESREECDLESSRLKDTVNFNVAQGPIVENSLEGIVIDLKSSTNTLPNEYLKILLGSAPSAIVNQTVGTSKRISNTNSISAATCKGTKRKHSVDEALWMKEKNVLASYDVRAFASKNVDAEMNDTCHSGINKRMRTKMDCKSACDSSSKLTYTPSTGWTIMKAQNNSQELAFTNAEKFMAQAQLQSLERLLLFGKADENTNSYHVLRNNLRSLNGLMKFGRNSTPVKPSGWNNSDISQPLTPDKPSGYSNSQESKICGTLVQYEASEDVNKPVKAKVRRILKRRIENECVCHCSSAANLCASLGQYPCIPIEESRHLYRKNSHHEVILFKGQDTSNYKASAKYSIPLDINSVDFIVHKLRQLSISSDLETAGSHAQNAIVPYVMNGGVMVPYEGSFELIKRRRLRAKVDLDPETNRVWKLLMGIEGEGNERASVDNEMWWEEERRIFRGRADSFIARMHLVQGDRRFSQWKGSVVDSVIGVFLTQNVSDHLSSSAFMSLAAKFPLRSEANSGAIIVKVDGTSENQIESSISFFDDPNFQRNFSNHDFYSQSHSEIKSHSGIKSPKNEGKKENSSDETFGSSTGSSSVVYHEDKCLESHETETNFGQDSPNSASNIAITVARSIGSLETEDRRLVEEVVSSQNSGVSSQSSMGCQPLSSDCVGSNSHEEDDFQIGNTNNGFAHSSFTELLHIAESNKFRELYCNGGIPIVNVKAILQNENNFPVPDHLGNSNGTYKSCNEFTPHQRLFGMSDMIPEQQFFCTLNPSNFTILKNIADNIKGEINSSLHSTISEVVEGTKFEVDRPECGEPVAENLADSKCLNKILSTSGAATVIDSHASIQITCDGQPIFLKTDINSSQQSLSDKKVAERADVSSNINFHECFNIQDGDMARFHEEDEHSATKVQSQTENSAHPKASSTSTSQVQISFDMDQTVGLNLKDYNFQKAISEQPKHELKVRKRKAGSEKKAFDWDSLRSEVSRTKPTAERNPGTMDSLDWEAVRCADVSEIAEAIRERGMNNMLAERIKDFLNRLVREHGGIDLEWLRDVPPEKSKDFLLSVRGLGLKSAECVRLLTLHHLAFPVDTNVGRICVRLGWVPLQPLPESLQLHLLEMYPVLETIQKYLWPRLCKLDQRTLYELHYQMITFGKVFCTKSKPNCNACPMRGECRHFASAFASARLALPAPEDKSLVSFAHPVASEKGKTPACAPTSIQQLECNLLTHDLTISKNCEPIIEEPSTPEPECQKTLENEIEDAFFEDPDEIPTIKLNFEKFTQNLQNYMQENMELQAADMSKALVALTPEAASIPMPKLKNISRLRTEHQVYEIPDSHPLLEGLDQREPDDPCPYLLAIWAPGEGEQSTESPEARCSCHDIGQLCDESACFACNSIIQSQAQKIRGTLLIPCRTAMRGSFPLNGTYFQVNEVFADHQTSRAPIDIPRDWIWNLNRRTVCFGTSIPTIFRGLTTEGIQHCFWRGFVCVRGFDRATRAPKPLYARLHFPASKALKNKKGGAAAVAEASDLPKNTLEKPNRAPS